MWLPACVIDGNHTVPNGVQLCGLGRNSVLAGVIVNNGVVLDVQLTGSITNGATAYYIVSDTNSFLHFGYGTSVDLRFQWGANQVTPGFATLSVADGGKATALLAGLDGGELVFQNDGKLFIAEDSRANFEDDASGSGEDANWHLITVFPETGNVLIDRDQTPGGENDPGEKLVVAGNVKATRLISTQATGTEPLTVASQTLVTNLNADMVDGLHASEIGAGGVAYAQVVTVAKSGGDYTTIQDAVDSITDAASDKRYLVRIMPGLYTEQVTMKSWVDFRGISKHTVQIQHTGDNNGTIILASWVQLEDVLIEGTATATEWAIVGTNTSNVHIRNIDILNPFGSGNRSQGIKVTGSTWGTLFVEHCVFNIYTQTGWGIYLTGNGQNIDTTINDIFVDTWDATTGGSIYFSNTADVQIRNSHIRTSANGNCIEIDNAGSEIEIAHTVMQGGSSSLQVNAGTVVVDACSIDTISGTWSGVSHDRDSSNFQVSDGSTNTLLAAAYLRLPEVAAPSTPDSGYGVLYEKTDGKPYFKNDAGTEYDLTSLVAALDDLTDVTITTPATGDVLQYGGVGWINDGLALDDLSDVDTSGASADDALIYNGATWEPEAVLLADGSVTGATVDDQHFTRAVIVGADENGIALRSTGLRLRGTATAWRDETYMLVGQSLESPASDITLNIPEGSITFDDDCTLVDYVVVTIQINHDWALTDVYPHIHWWQTSANIPNWLIQYRWQVQGLAKTTAWTNVPYAAHIFTYSSGTLNQITTFGTLSPPPGVNVSDHLQIRLLRDTDNDSTEFAADPLVGDVDAVSLDIHIEVDGFGSDLEYVHDDVSYALTEGGDYLLTEGGDRLLWE